MFKLRLLAVLVTMTIFLSACATVQERLSPDSDIVVQEFFSDLQKSDHHGAYDLFAKGLSQAVSYDQFDGLISSMRDQWGSLVDEQTVVLPFHKREGEGNFIPLGVAEENIKRYVYELTFDHATINCDLTLVLKDDQYKIVWISFWGSNVYLTPAIQEKLEAFFSQPSE